MERADTGGRPEEYFAPMLLSTVCLRISSLKYERLLLYYLRNKSKSASIGEEAVVALSLGESR